MVKQTIQIFGRVKPSRSKAGVTYIVQIFKTKYSIFSTELWHGTNSQAFNGLVPIYTEYINEKKKDKLHFIRCTLYISFHSTFLRKQGHATI